MMSKIRDAHWAIFDVVHGRVAELVRRDGGVLARVVNHELYGFAYFVYSRPLINNPDSYKIRALVAKPCYNFADGMDLSEGFLLGVGNAGANSRT